MIKKTFVIKDMHCANCAMRLQGLEDELPGVLEVDASYHKMKMTVSYDENRLSPEDIIAAAGNMGYTAVEQD